MVLPVTDRHERDEDMEITKKQLTAEDGTVITVGIPAGPMPTADQVAAYKAAFTRVQNKLDWKMPVDATVTVARLGDIDVITDAIEFYTATEARVQFVGPERRELGRRDGWTVRITAPGYYAGPAN